MVTLFSRFIFGLLASLALASVAAAQGTLPRPDPAFEGKIGRTFAESTVDFPKEVRAPKGAPNILLIMTDDVGFPFRFNGKLVKFTIDLQAPKVSAAEPPQIERVQLAAQKARD